MPKRRAELDAELASLVERLTQEIVYAFAGQTLEELGVQPRRPRRMRQEPRELMARLAAHMREFGVSRLDAIVRESPRARRKRKVPHH